MNKSNFSHFLVTQPVLQPFPLWTNRDTSEDQDEQEKDAVNYWELTILLPNDKILIAEEPVLAVWDPAARDWRRFAFVSHQSYDVENAAFKFRLFTSGFFAFFQRNSMHFPYHSWELRPIGNGHISFAIRTQLVKLNFELKDAKICLSIPDEYEWPQLRHLNRQWVELHEMIQLLENHGLYLFPSDHMSDFSNWKSKNSDLETKTCREIAWLADRISVQHSRWNRSCRSDAILFRCVPMERMNDLPYDEWPIVLMQDSACILTKETEKATKLNIDEILSKATENASLAHLMVQSCNQPATLQDILNSSFNHVEFVDNVFRWLLLIRIFSYAM